MQMTNKELDLQTQGSISIGFEQQTTKKWMHCQCLWPNFLWSH